MLRFAFEDVFESVGSLSGRRAHRRRRMPQDALSVSPLPAAHARRGAAERRGVAELLCATCASLAARGKKPIGWDEILEGVSQRSGRYVVARRAGRLAASAGHDAVMAPETHVYFDRSHYNCEDERGRLSVNTLENVYSYEPIPAGGHRSHAHPRRRRHDVDGGHTAAGRYCLYALSASWRSQWRGHEARDWNTSGNGCASAGARLTAAGIGYYPDVGVWS